MTFHESQKTASFRELELRKAIQRIPLTNSPRQQLRISKSRRAEKLERQVTESVEENSDWKLPLLMLNSGLPNRSYRTAESKEIMPTMKNTSNN
jgi:hypothetical protein